MIFANEVDDVLNDRLPPELVAWLVELSDGGFHNGVTPDARAQFLIKTATPEHPPQLFGQAEQLNLLGGFV